jgi:hypothetical protein
LLAGARGFAPLPLVLARLVKEVKMPNPKLDFGYSHQHLADSAIVLTGSGILHTVTINRPDTTGGAIVTLYDGVDNTGTVIAIITMDVAVFVIPATLTYDVAVVTGIYAEFSHAVTADITISFN